MTRLSASDIEAKSAKNKSAWVGTRPTSKLPTTAPKPSKYGNKKTEVDGIVFDSKREAKRWAELQLLERAGKITKLDRQVKYILIPSQKRDDGTTERGVTYTADFIYWAAGKLVVEDAKGFKTQQGILRRKMMLRVYHITVKEV